MKHLISLIAVAFTATTAASGQATNSDASGRPSADVVVTGQRLSDSGSALKACIARRCPPDEDIHATLTHAENLFVAGDYKRARNTLQDGIGRDKRFARQYPVPVSDLMRAYSRVAAHLGEAEDFRRATLGSLEALKAGLPGTDPRVLAERLEVGDMFAHVGNTEQALAVYRRIGSEAEELGLPHLRGLALLRVAMLDYQAATGGIESSSDRAALAEIDALAANPDPKLAPYAFVARVLRAEYDARHGDPKPLAAAMTEMRSRLGGTRPVLLHADPIQLSKRPVPVEIFAGKKMPMHETLSRMPVGSFEGQWVDVSFWIRPDGAVSDVGVLRQSAGNTGDWNPPILRSIATRRYGPLKLPPDNPGLLRVEHYTYTSFFDPTQMDTRLPQRDGQPRVEVVDLSQD